MLLDLEQKNLISGQELVYRCICIWFSHTGERAGKIQKHFSVQIFSGTRNNLFLWLQIMSR